MRKNRVYGVLILSLTLALPACATRNSISLENQELRLTALEDRVYNQIERQENINAWLNERLTALEAKHPDIKVSPEPVTMQRETMVHLTNRDPSEQGEVVDVKPGEVPVTAASQIKPAAPVQRTITPPVEAKPAVPTVEAKPIAPPAEVKSKEVPPPPSDAAKPAGPDQAQAVPSGTVTATALPPKEDASQGRVVLPEPDKPSAVVVEKPSAPAAGLGPVAGDKSSYAAALALLERGKTEDGRVAMEKFLEKYPQSSLVPNALYWQGEAYYTQLKYDDAIFIFKDIVSRFPKSNKAPDAMLKIAMSYQKISDFDNAKFYLQLLVDDYPGSRSAGLAKKQLAGLK